MRAYFGHAVYFPDPVDFTGHPILFHDDICHCELVDFHVSMIYSGRVAGKLF